MQQVNALRFPHAATSATPLQSIEQMSRKMVADLNAMSAASPLFSAALAECAEEVSWKAKLKPVGALATAAPTPKRDSQQLITILRGWAELYPFHSASLLSCVEEIEGIAALRERTSERRHARGIVLDAVGRGYGTGPQIAQLTGLSDRTVRWALRRLHHFNLIQLVGCGAVTPADGNRTRLWSLTRTAAA